MKDIVIIPTFDRPEYLWTCLENIWQNVTGLAGKEIWICEDIHSDKPKGFTIEMEMLATIREFEKKFGRDTLKYRATLPHLTYGNSFNVLWNLYDAAKTDARYVYIIEDDVLVTPDFFQWNELMQMMYEPFVTCAGRLNRSLNFHMNGPDAMDETIKDPRLCKQVKGAYNSWATCFPRTSLDRMLVVGDVFAEPAKPGLEQDMMIQNFMRSNKLSSIWPYVPRAYHMGWYSYHRDGMRFNGTLEEKVKALQSAVTSQEKIRAMACIQEIDAFPKKHHEPATDLYLRP
jgi:hypothetical protein